MDYLTFIEQNKLNDDFNGNYENHHILPRSIRPDLINEPSNIVKLSAFNHCMAHFYIMDYYKNNIKSLQKMKYTFNFMVTIDNSDKISENEALILSKKYEEFKLLYHNIGHSNETKEKIKKSNTGLKRSKEICEKIGLKSKGRQSTLGYHWYNNGIETVYAKNCPENFVAGSLRKPMLGKTFKHSKESKEKIGNKNKGRTFDNERKLEMSKITRKLWENNEYRQNQISKKKGKSSNKKGKTLEEILGYEQSIKTRQKQSESAKKKKIFKSIEKMDAHLNNFGMDVQLD